MSGKPHTISRFYQRVSIEPEGRYWTVLLDEKTLRTPARSILRLPTKALASKIAEEWDAQEKNIRPSEMPFTKLANVAHDHMGTSKAMTAGELVRFASGDVLCFRVSEPMALQELQVEKWDHWLDWAEEKFGARPGITTDLRAPQMPLALLENMRNLALEMDVYVLTALAHATSILGSAILGFALLEGKLKAKEALDLSRLEEHWQIERWGTDKEAQVRVEYLLGSLQTSVDFMGAARN